MNVKIVKFLLANQTALLQIVEIAKKWDKSLSLLKQWALVDQIAQIVLPILEANLVSPKALANPWESDDDDYERMSFAANVEFSTLGIDWQLLVDVIIPVIVAILRALSAGEK